MKDAGFAIVPEQPKPPHQAKIEQDERSRQIGYDAGFAAKLAGKPTPRAPDGVDGVSYASGAVEGAAAAERDRRSQRT